MPELFVTSRELSNRWSFRRPHLPSHHGARLTPGQTGVGVALIGLGTPAVRFSTAGIDLVKGTAQEGSVTQDLLEQTAVLGKEGKQLSLSIEA